MLIDTFAIGDTGRFTFRTLYIAQTYKIIFFPNKGNCTQTYKLDPNPLSLQLSTHSLQYVR